MKKRILERYRRDSDGQLVIDIAASKVSDLYDDFDKHAPFIKKELDYDLVEYLIESAGDLGKEPFGVSFSFAAGLDQTLETRVLKSIQNYFHYLLEKNRRELHAMIRKSLILLLLGVVMLSYSVYINHVLEPRDSVFKHILAEGLVIASWVSMWEALAGMLLEWQPLVHTRKVYARLVKATYSFRCNPPAGTLEKIYD